MQDSTVYPPVDSVNDPIPVVGTPVTPQDEEPEMPYFGNVIPVVDGFVLPPGANFDMHPIVIGTPQQVHTVAPLPEGNLAEYPNIPYNGSTAVAWLDQLQQLEPLEPDIDALIEIQEGMEEIALDDPGPVQGAAAAAAAANAENAEALAHEGPGNPGHVVNASNLLRDEL